MGIPRDRRGHSEPDRNGPVASFQRPEEASHTPEGTRTSQERGSLNTGKEFFRDQIFTQGETRMNTITRHYIDGAFVESHGREVMDIINPTNSKVSGRVTL